MSENRDLATISFQAEAFESAAAFFMLLTPGARAVTEMANGIMTPVSNGTQGYTVHVVTNHIQHDKTFAEFDAEVRDVTTGDDGQYKLVVWEWDDDAGRGDPNGEFVLDIYDDIVRVEVI